jgi:hypothetical protein
MVNFGKARSLKIPLRKFATVQWLTRQPGGARNFLKGLGRVLVPYF